MSGNEIAVVGMAGRFPGAAGIEEFWSNLWNGVDSVAALREDELRRSGVSEALLANPAYVRSRGVLEGIEMFDAAFFGFSPREASILNPQHRVFLECAWEALEHAGYGGKEARGRTGVYAGADLNSYWLRVAADEALVRSVGGMSIAHGNESDHIPLLASYKLDLDGPSINVQATCASSLVAIHLACQSLLGGECDLALAGGVSITIPQRSGYLYQPGGAVSPEGRCRAFDADAGGTAPGSGAGVVALRRLADALEDGDTVYAVVRGTAVNNDGAAKNSYAAPRAAAQARVIAEAQGVAGVAPGTVSYVEGHGSATPIGDAVELDALLRVFRGGAPGSCRVGSVKSNVGHLNAAAGVTAFIKTVLALHHRRLPATLHVATPHPLLRAADSPVAANMERREWEAAAHPRRAGVSSFGMGGTNGHAVLEEAPAPRPAPQAPPFELLVLSARTPAALERVAARLAEALAAPGPALADVAHTLRVGRAALPHRRYLVCAGRDEARAALAAPARAEARGMAEGERKAAFLFPGLGGQHAGMVRGLYRDEPVFRAEVDRCAALAEPWLGADLRSLLCEGAPAAGAEAGIDLAAMLGRGGGGAPALERTVLAHPATFVAGYALAKLLASWGIAPAVMLGHSLGEYVAACLAGVFSLEDALRLVVERARLLEELPEGTLLAVPLGREALEPLLGAEVALAAVNSPMSCTVAGPAAAAAALAERLARDGVVTQRLPASQAFHSPSLEPLLERFAACVRRTERGAPRTPLLSSLTGLPLTADEARSEAYWVRHLRETVRFDLGVGELLRDPEMVLLELGPGGALASFALQAGARPEAVVPTLPGAWARQSDTAALLHAVGRLWTAGVRVDWSAFQAHVRGRGRVPLPTYPFERARHWVDAEPRPFAPPAEPARGAALVPAWSRSRRRGAEGWAAGGSWLLVDEPGGTGARLAATLGAAGADAVRLASPGDLPGSVEPLRAAGRGPLRVVHFAGVEGTAAAARLVAALDGVEGAEIDFVVDRLHDVGCGAGGDPAQAALLGLASAGGVRCRVVDLRAEDADACEALACELARATRDDVVALRGGWRWARHLVEERPAEAGRAADADAEPRVCLFSGALEAGAARIARALSGPGATLAVLRTAAGGEAGARRVVDGAEFVVLEDGTADEIRRAAAPWGPIRGLVHTAGFADDSWSGALAGVEREADRCAALAEELGARFCILHAAPGGGALRLAATERMHAECARRGGDACAWSGISWEGSPGAMTDGADAALRAILASGPPPELRLVAAPAEEAEEAPASAPATMADVAAREEGGVERALCAILEAVTGVEPVGPDDDFFRLGGNSLFAARVVLRAREDLGVEITVRDLFDAPTPREMAALLLERSGAASAPAAGTGPEAGMEPGDESAPGEPLPLSYDQQRIWISEQLHQGMAAYNLPLLTSVPGGIDVPAAERAIAEVVRRHPMLRTTFPAPDGVPVQVVGPAAAARLATRDLHGVPADEKRAAVAQAMGDLMREPFDLARGPLWRAQVLHVEAGMDLVALVVHHIAVDDVSMEIILREFHLCYEAFRAGAAPVLPPLAGRYADYVRRQAELLAPGRLDGQLAFWRAHLEGAPFDASLPTTYPRPEVLGSRGGNVRRYLDAGLVRRLEAAAQGERATLFMLLLAATRALLFRYSGQEDLVIGTVASQRPRMGLEGAVGYFLNTVAVRTRCGAELAFRELLAAERESMLGVDENLDVPLELVLDELRPPRSANRHPLFQVMCALRKTVGAGVPAARPAAPSALADEDRAHARLIDPGTSIFDLSVQFDQGPDTCYVDLEYSAELFSREAVERMGEHLENLLSALAGGLDRRVCDLPLLDGGDRASLLALGRGPARPYAADAMLHTLFEAQAARTPHAQAASCGGRSLTYAELNAAANRLAHRLRGMGIAPEARVALLLERSLDTAVATLAVLKAGAACVPIDPDYPAERVAYLLADSGAQAVLTHSSAGALPDAGAATIVRLDEMEAELAMESAENPRPLAGPESLAYVIYTSGSTGRPKGAMVEHGSLVCYATEMAERLGLGEGERVLQFASPGFDVVIEELFPAWVSGACVVFSRAELMDPPVLTRVLEEEGISVLELPTAFWHEWVHELARTGRALPGTLRRVLVGGERVSAERLAEWAGLGVELVHVFGLTETACTSSILELPAGDAGERWANLPIGTPLANVEMYVVDAWMSPVPAGVPGELLIGGRGVGRGYLGRPSLTAERFIPHPFGGQPGARVYRTGDRVRWLEDGTMEFLGRADHQAKIRGFRVEPAEVEAALERHPAVREACVVVSDDASGGRRLVAYLTGGAADAAPLRAHLRERLPEYMVPGAFVFLDALPLSPNGKVDRRALPAPGAVGSADAYVAPRTRAEVELAAIWAEVLGVERVGAHDHFFDLGGHSLHAMRVISRTRHTLGVELPLRALFEAPVLEAFAARVDGHAAGAESLIDALERLSDEEVRELLAEPLAPEAR